MSSSGPINSDDLASFQEHLARSTRIVALLGAGLSASSGLPTFRGAGGYWRTHNATTIATPQAFQADPALVWQFYSYRRHMALNAKPNPAHMALVALSHKKPEFLTLSQNVDGLSPRAGHPPDQLKLLHGNLFDVKCSNEHNCDYKRSNDFSDPIVPALALPAETIEAERELQTGQHDQPDSSSNINTTHQPPVTPRHSLLRGQDISQASIPLPTIPQSSLPHCPQCSSLLRPDVVWFGEHLPRDIIDSFQTYLRDPRPIDLLLVIGTSSTVFPAASYTMRVRGRGAKVAVVNIEAEDAARAMPGIKPGADWVFVGDAAVIVPELLRKEIGEVELFE